MNNKNNNFEENLDKKIQELKQSEINPSPSNELLDRIKEFVLSCKKLNHIEEVPNLIPTEDGKIKIELLYTDGMTMNIEVSDESFIEDDEADFKIVPTNNSLKELQCLKKEGIEWKSF